MEEPDWLEALRRNSGLALTKEGVWTFRGNEVENPRVQAMFHRGVAVRPDGALTLQVGHMWCYVEAAGPVRFARAVHLDDEPRVRLLGDREWPLVGPGDEPTIAGWGPDDRLYLWLAGLAGLDGPVICLREAHQTLMARLEGEGDPWLDLGADRRIALALLEEIPTARSGRPRARSNDRESTPRA